MYKIFLLNMIYKSWIIVVFAGILGFVTKNLYTGMTCIIHICKPSFLHHRNGTIILF